jgi:hypothetical protein
MNWIGKLSNYGAVNVQKEQTEETNQQQSPAPLSTLGIAGTNDQFETVNSAISQFTVSLPTQQDLSTARAQQSSPEMVSAAGIFESVNTLDSNLFGIATPETSQTPQAPPVATPGKINMEALLAVKEKLIQDPMDWNAIFTSLEQIPNRSDYFATLQELYSDGNLKELLEKLPPEGYGKLGEHLATALENQESNPGGFPAMLTAIHDFELSTSVPKGRFSDTIQQFIQTSGDKLDSSHAFYCLRILNADSSPENRLSNLFAMKQLVTRPQFSGVHFASDPSDMTYDPLLLDDEIKNFVYGYASGSVEVPPPGIQKALERFPEFSKTMLTEVSDPNRPRDFESKFAERLIASGENVGTAFSRFLTDSPTNPSLSNFLEQLWPGLRKANSAKADDILREAITNAGAADFSKLSPEVLIELKLVLLQGDDTDLNQKMINEVINPAFEIAKNN